MKRLIYVINDRDEHMFLCEACYESLMDDQMYDCTPDDMAYYYYGEVYSKQKCDYCGK